MDLNKSVEFTPPSTPSFTPSSTPSPQVHNFMPMSPLMLPYRPSTNEDDEEARHTRFMQIQKQNLELFWHQQMLEIYSTSVLKSNHTLPLARIKKIMKTDKGVKMISADTPVLFSKACELFILDLTLRSWMQTEEGNRRTLQRCDLTRAMKLDDVFNFLVKAMPLDQHRKDDETGKSSEKIETHPATQLQFPLLDMNAKFVMKSPEASEQFMVKPPMSSAEFHFGSSSK